MWGGHLPPLLAVGSLHMPVGSLNAAPPASSVIKIFLLDYPRGLVKPAGILTNETFKELRAVFGI